MIARLLPGCLLAGLLSMTGAAHADDKPACRYVKMSTLPITYTGEGLQPAVTGAIDDVPAVMLVDTGAHRSYLTRAATDKHKLALSATGGYAYGIGGATQVYSARLKDFAIGGAHGGRMSLPVLGDMSAAPSYEAIVGADFLLQMDLEVALADKRLTFFRPSGCKDTFLGYWGQDVMEIPFSGGSDESLNPHFAIELNGKKMDAVIDSGATRSMVSARAAERAGLKPGAAGVARAGSFSGVGSKLAARWSATFDTFKIGEETITNAEIDIIESSTDMRRSPDVLLGQDFLRAHRVLFAMSQERLYISYLGGQVFATQRKEIEPWIVQEAEAGNADAQFLLAQAYLGGKGIAQDNAQGKAWLYKAGDQENPRANAHIGRVLLRSGHSGEAAARLRRAVDKQPSDRFAALLLYLARLQGGDPETAKRELETSIAAADQRAWPLPIAHFYLGRIDAEALMAQAAKQADQPALRSCEAGTFIAELQAARATDKASAKALRDAGRSGCATQG